jgi:hypothetical protein
MDFLNLIGAANRALSFLGSDIDEPWASSEQAFLTHFGVPYEAFLEVIQHLSPRQEEVLHATFEVNPEAAVLWILAMDEIVEG